MSEQNTIKKFSLEVTCSICLEYFSDPVILKCGHNFCHHCILKYWREFVSKNTCPQCKVVTESGSLRANKPLEKFVKLLRELNDEAGGKQACEKHQEPWKYFCKDHQAPICLGCEESTEHEGHNTISLEQAAQEMKDYFSEFLDCLQNQQSVILEHKTRTEKESQDLLEMAEVMKKETEARFEELHRVLKSEEYFLMHRISEVEKGVMQTQEERMDMLFQELSSHNRLVRELQDKCSQQANDLLQDIRSTLERCKMKQTPQSFQSFPPEKHWEMWDLWDANIFLQRATRQFQGSLKPAFSLKPAGITLDKETAHPRLILSSDLKTVKLGDKAQNVPKCRKRFNKSLSVLGCEEFTAGRNYWDVSVGEEGEWIVGVARKSVRRKNTVPLGPKAGIWAIGKRANEYFVLNSPNSPRLQYSGELRRIRIFFNYPGTHVTFFDADGANMIHHAFANKVSKETFLPYFHLSENAVLTLTHPD